MMRGYDENYCETKCFKTVFSLQYNVVCLDSSVFNSDNSVLSSDCNIFS